MQWNDSDGCVEIQIEELDICLFGAQDIMVDATFRCWAMNPRHVEVQLGAKSKFSLDANSPSQSYIRRLCVDALLTNKRYAELVSEADEMIDAADQRRYRRDVGYGHQQHEFI